MMYEIPVILRLQSAYLLSMVIVMRGLIPHTHVVVRRLISGSGTAVSGAPLGSRRASAHECMTHVVALNETVTGSRMCIFTSFLTVAKPG